MNSDPPICESCGALLDSATPGGLCPRCLMAGAMQPTEPTAGVERPAPPSIDAVQAAFPHLAILEFIGQGGMSWVFKARQPKLDRLVALKLLPASLAARDPAFAGRFEREGQLLARLHHPNIVAVHDSGAAGEFFYLLMEFVEGVNLRQAMRSSRFTPAQALAIVPHICDALQFAHEEGVLHRDIKPENILLDAKGRVKLVDFGIAKLIGAAAEPNPAAGAEDAPALNLTQSGATLGTPSYMAPEQRDSPADVDHRADIYSLGVVFYELLTGELPTGSFAPPSAKSAADPRVDAIVQQALEKERTRRQSSAGEMKTQVQTLSGPSAAPPPAEHKLLHLEGVTTFRSLTAMRFAQTACIGFVGFLGYIPGWRALFGFYGFFGLIGVAYLIEAVARRKGPAGAPSTRPGKTGWLPITLPALVFVIVFLGILGAVVRVQNTQVPIPASLTLPAAASFGPVIQRLIATGTAPDSFYSVDSADYVPPPADISPLLWKSYAEWTWLTLSDVDFLAVAETGSPRLVLSDMVISSCDEADFDRWSPRDLADDIGVRTAFASLVRPNFNEPLTGNHGGRITLAFQTRYQRIGMVQVLGISRDPPGVMIRYKLIQDAAVSQSKRQRFEPTDGMADKTSWEVDDKPSEWNPNGWAIIAHMTLGGVAQARLPGQTEDFCRIKLTAGNDQAVTLDIDDLKANNSMTITLERDHWTDLVVNGINYRIGYPAVYVAAGQPDSTAYALIVVTHSAPATPPVAQSAPADSDPEVLKIQLRSAEHDLLQKQQAFNAGMISEADFDAAHDKVALLIARLSGDPVQIANATLQAAQRQFDLIFKLHESRLLTDSDFYKARDEVAIARVKLREAEANAASSKAASSPPAGPVSGPSPTPAAAIVPGIELQTAEQQLTQTLTDIQETQISLAEASLRYTSLHPRIIDIKSKLNTLQQQADRLRASIRQAVGYNPPQAASGPSPEVADPIPAIELRIEEQQLAQALLDIQDAQNTLALLKTRYGDSHPQVILARTRLDALQSQAARLRALIRQHSAPQ